jgi:hypothetical protein
MSSGCITDASCNFPNGICRSGSCMCDGAHEGSTCGTSTKTIINWLLKFGLPALCIIAALLGIFLGGTSRWCYSRINEWNKLRKRKTALFGNGWFDSDRYIGPNHHTIVVKKKEKKRDKKKKKSDRSRDRSRGSRSPARSRSRSKSRGRSPRR